MLCMRSPCVIDTRWQGTLLELNLAFLMNLFFRDGEYCTVRVQYHGRRRDERRID